MVASSRKKNKGRDRKAKKAEAERAKVHALWLGWATGTRVTGQTIACDHGCGILSNDLDHPVMKFIDEMFTPDSSVGSLLDVLQTTLAEAVLNDERYRDMLVKIFIRMGTNKLLNEEYNGALTLARTIVPLELYDGTESTRTVINCRRVQTKVRDLDNVASARRDALKFFSKRVPCSCLKKMHQEARRMLPKIGFCYGCPKEKERVALSVCSRCMIAQYCSRECQVANWPEHKEDCDLFVKTHIQLTQTADENDEIEKDE